MEKIITESLENAWMIRNDGKEFRLIQHIYGSSDEVEETLYAAEGLYNATQHASTRNLVVNLIASWAYATIIDVNNLIEDIHLAIDARPYKFLSHEFVDSIQDQLLTVDCAEDLTELNQLVVNELNQEFLRARYGGMYNTIRGNREMIFRVSSKDFNWFNIIFEFVYNHQNSIDTVTVVKDEESTGFSDVYYHNGTKLENLPTADFINVTR